MPSGVANEWVKGADISLADDVVISGTSNGAGNMQWFTFYYHFQTAPPLGSQVLPIWGRYFLAGAHPLSNNVPHAVGFDNVGNIVLVGVADDQLSPHSKMVELRYSASGVQTSGTPIFAPNTVTPGADIVLGWSLDKQSSLSAIVGLRPVFEAGQSASVSDWTLLVNGP